MVKIKFKKLVEDAIMPTQANKGDAGWDVRAAEQLIIRPYSCAKVKTGLSVEIPVGYELQVRGKSGLALNENITIAQGIGTIDAGYRGEVCVLIYNQACHIKRIEKGAMIAQLVLGKVYDVEWELTTDLTESERGAKGFGSTPTKKTNENV